eukprot:8536690-Pyramimonas_sp.AAC.1
MRESSSLPAAGPDGTVPSSPPLRIVPSVSLKIHRSLDSNSTDPSEAVRASPSPTLPRASSAHHFAAGPAPAPAAIGTAAGTTAPPGRKPRARASPVSM